MKERPIEFKTRKNQRVYRRRIYSKTNPEPTYANHYTLRVRQDKKDSYFSLGTDKRKAGTLADEIVSFLGVDGNTVEEALENYSKSHRSKKLRLAKRIESQIPLPDSKAATVNMVCERYLEVSSHLSLMTIRNNTNAIRHIAAGIMNLPKLDHCRTKVKMLERRTKTGAFPISKFTKEAVEKYRQRELNAVKDDFKKLGSATTTTNSYIRAARGIFAKKMLHHYHDLNLPDFTPFIDVPQLPEPTHRYHSKINLDDLMQLALKELRTQDPVSWIIFLLSIGVGLRRNEIDKLTREQIDIENSRVWIRTTAYFRPKAKNSEGYVDVDDGILTEITTYLDSPNASDPIFFIPGITAGNKLRGRKAFGILYAWLRSHGVNEQKPLHTLRKEAGSAIFKKLGSIDKTATFLRNDPRTAKEHYVGRKERIEMELPGLG